MEQYIQSLNAIDFTEKTVEFVHYPCLHSVQTAEIAKKSTIKRNFALALHKASGKYTGAFKSIPNHGKFHILSKRTLKVSLI